MDMLEDELIAVLESVDWPYSGSEAVVEESMLMEDIIVLDGASLLEDNIIELELTSPYEASEESRSTEDDDKGLAVLKLVD